jgi:hypothetical protein
MKKLQPLLLITIPEVLLLGLVYLGVWFKIMHLPWANVMLTLVLLTLAFIYMVLGTLIFSNIDPRKLKLGKKTEPYTLLKLGVGFLAGMCMAIFVVGYWEHMLRLPLAKTMLIAGCILLGILTLVSLGVSIKYPRFLLVMLRLFISFMLNLLPFFIIW